MIRLLTPLYGKTPGQIIEHWNSFFVEHAPVLQEVYEKAEQVQDRGAFLFQPEALMIYDLLEAHSIAVR